MTPRLSSQWLKNEVAAAARANMNFVAVDALSMPLLQTVLRLCYHFGMRPPVWRHTPTVRKALNWFGIYS